jgi:hypothetical protein
MNWNLMPSIVWSITKSFLNLNEKQLQLVSKCTNQANDNRCKINGTGATDAILLKISKIIIPGALTTLNLRHCDDKLTDTGLEQLTILTNLRHLILLTCSNVTDVGISKLIKLENLEYLRLENCEKLTNECINHVSCLTNLQYFKLSHINKGKFKFDLTCLNSLVKLKTLILTYCNNLTDENIKQIMNMNLLCLSLTACYNITDEGIKYASNLLNLREFGLGHTKTTNTGVKYLSKLIHLESLGLQNCKITNLQPVFGLTKLRYLDFSGCDITDKDLNGIFNLTELQELGAGNCHKITDIGLNYIFGLTNLKILRLNHCTNIVGTELNIHGSKLEELNLNISPKVNDSFLEQIPNLSLLRKLDLTACNITNKGLEHVFKLKHLQKLVLLFCDKITNEYLHNMIPDGLDVTWPKGGFF